MQAATPTVSVERSALALPRLPWRPLSAAAVTVIAGVLRLVALSGTQTNPFYDAAVRSMGQSWHNFFFAAFEPGGGVSIDKPPVDLWLQVVSVKLFGLNAVGLILPQAIAATVAVALLYDVVRRMFGHAIGLASAIALAVLPLSVVTSRSDTMDSLMMALTVASAWLVVRAAQTGRARFLFVAAAVMGINFEVKLFEALIALPALVLLYLIADRTALPRRIARLVASLAIFLVFALAWPTVVSLVPAGSRPFPLGSTNGSVWNAMFVYNGTDRINPPPWMLVRVPNPSGPNRLFQFYGYHFGQDVGVELFAALVFGGVALGAGALAMFLRYERRRLGQPAAEGEPAEPRAGPPPLTLAGAVCFAVWLLLAAALFSHNKGVLHERYIEAMSPAVAVGVGAGILMTVRLAATRAAGLLVFLVALAITTRWTYSVATAISGATLATVSVLLAAAAAVAAVAAWACGRTPGRLARRAPAMLMVAAALTISSVLAPAVVRSVDSVRTKTADSGAPGAKPVQWINALSSYFKRHDPHARYEAASASYGNAETLIVRDGRPLLVLSSVKRANTVGVPELRRKVLSGEVRYAIIGGGCGTDPLPKIGYCPPTVQWIRHHAVDVTAETGVKGDPGLVFRLTVPARSAAGRGSS